jgi:hypothetical protein
VTVSPGQIASSEAVMVGVTGVFRVVDTGEEVALQPFEPVTVTVRVAVVVT